MQTKHKSARVYEAAKRRNTTNVNRARVQVSSEDTANTVANKFRVASSSEPSVGMMVACGDLCGRLTRSGRNAHSRMLDH